MMPKEMHGVKLCLLENAARQEPQRRSLLKEGQVCFSKLSGRHAIKRFGGMDAAEKNLSCTKSAGLHILCTIALIAVIGFSFAACDNGSSPSRSSQTSDYNNQTPDNNNQTPDGVTYTVTFNPNGATTGTTPTTQTVSAGSSITLPGRSGLSKTGFIFGGWNINATGKGTNYNASSSYTVNGNVTFYARWDVDVEGKWLTGKVAGAYTGGSGGLIGRYKDYTLTLNADFSFTLVTLSVSEQWYYNSGLVS
jgi:uncharacterized repeat protein (TIGR02543 family)